MVTGSVEWQRPITVRGNRSDWEQTVFVDAGSVADKPNQMTVHTGVGTGIRWASPVGPVQADIAYGLKTQQFRLHLRMGFTF
jgi:translocation and assembly module TamA